MRAGREARERARRHLGARQGRLARRAPALAAARASAALTLRVWQSIPHEQVARRRAQLGLRSGFGSPLLRLGYLKVFMDGTLGSQTAWMLDGSGVQITSGDGARRDRAPRAPQPGFPVAVHAIGDRREPRGARRVRADARRLGSRSACASGSSTAQLLAPEDLPRFAALGVACSVQFSHAPSDRDLADRLLGRQDRRRVRLPLAARLRRASSRTARDAPIEELDPLAGIRAGVRRTIDERAGLAPRAGADRRAGVPRDVRRARLARAATSAAAAR